MGKIIHYFLKKIQAQKYVINKYGIIFFIINKIKILLIKLIPNLVLLIIFFPIALTIRFISPFYLIRFQQLISNRFGHYLSQTEIYLCEKKLKINLPKQKYKDFFFNMYEGCCNKYIEKILKKKINVIHYRLGNPINILNNFISFFSKNSNFYKINLYDNDLLNLFQRCDIQLKIPDFDKKKGIKILNNIGIKENTKFVCIAARGDDYLRTRHPNVDWSYHDYRNSSIYNFLDAVDYLNSKGYYVIRLGKNVNEKIKSNNLMLIDYADSKFQDDFMDLFLCLKCSFFISTGFGLDQAPYIFRKKILYVNWPKFDEIFSWSPNAITIFKHYYSIKNKKKLSVKEIFEQNLEGVSDTRIFKEKKIVLLENSPLEIKELVQEFLESQNKSFIISQKDNSNQKKFWEIYKYYMIKKNFSKNHSIFRSNIGYNFLRKNEHLLN